MKRAAPFIIIAVVAVLTLAAGRWLLRQNAQAHTKAATPAPASSEASGIESEHSLGPENPPVTLVEYGDFQCPACALTASVIRSVENEYRDRLRVVFWQFPLPMHSHGREAAIAAEAASRQGRFWEMHDLLYQHQNTWTRSNDVPAEFENYALELHLNMTRFRQDIQSASVTDRVEAERKHGASLGVKSTPTIFINGKEFPPPFTAERLREAIDAALAAKKNP
jgi:protein-disulfide isomerase